MATTALWTNAAAQDGVVLLFRTLQSGKTGSLITGVKCCSYFVFPDYYDADVYRDEFVFPNGLGVVDNKESLLAGGAGADLKLLIDTAADGTSTFSTITAGTESIESGSDAFIHVPPRPTKKSRTMLFFWNGTIDTSSVVFNCWADEYRGFSVQPFANA